MNKKNNKKGQLTQIVVWMLVIFAVGTTIILGGLILDKFYLALDDSGINTPEMLEVQSDMETSYAVFDYSMVILSIVLFIGLVITSFFIPTHPIFMVINIIGIFILVFLGMVMTNVYGEMVAGETGIETNLSDVADDYTKTNYLISNLPFLGAIILFIISIVMFAKGKGGNY